MCRFWHAILQGDLFMLQRRPSNIILKGGTFYKDPHIVSYAFPPNISVILFFEKSVSIL